MKEIVGAIRDKARCIDCRYAFELYGNRWICTNERHKGGNMLIPVSNPNFASYCKDFEARNSYTQGGGLNAQAQ